MISLLKFLKIKLIYQEIIFILIFIQVRNWDGEILKRIPIIKLTIMKVRESLELARIKEQLICSVLEILLRKKITIIMTFLHLKIIHRLW
jgi:hypothetical protein